MMSLTLVTAPAAYPVSLAEIKKQLEITEHAEDDAIAAGLLAAVTTWAEGYLGRSLISRTYKGYLDAWPTDRWGSACRALELPRPPLVSITHLKTYDDEDAATTVSSGDYYVDTIGTVGRLVLRAGASTPSATRVANGIEVQYVAGFGSNPADVPEDIRHAILLHAAALRDDPNAEPSGAVKALAGPHRLWNA